MNMRVDVPVKKPPIWKKQVVVTMLVFGIMPLPAMPSLFRLLKWV